MGKRPLGKIGEKLTTIYAYRFFDKKEPAEKALAKILEVIPKAELIEYTLTETDKKYKN